MSDTVERKSAGRRKSADESDDLEMEDESQVESVSITIPVDASVNGTENTAHDLEYRATDCPKWNIALFLGFQVR